MLTRPPPTPHEAYLVRQDDGSQWEPDVVVQVQRSSEWLITDHPVEDGVATSDHIQKQPSTVTLTVVVTESPRPGLVGGIVHIEDKMRWLYDTADAGQLVNVVTRRRGVWEGYAIQTLPETLDKVARLRFDFTLRQVRKATATAVRITVDDLAPEVETGAPDEADAGEQPTEETGEPDVDPAVEDDRSILAGLLDALA